MASRAKTCPRPWAGGSIVFAIGALLGVLPSVAVAATSSSALLACQNRIAGKVKSLASFTGSKLHGCTEKVVDCKLASEIDASDATACLGSATQACSGLPALVTSKVAAAKAKILAKCGLIPIGDLKQFVGGLGFANVSAGCSGASDVTSLTDCVLNGVECAVETEVFIRDPRARDSLTTAMIASSFPCVAPPTATPTLTPTATPTDVPTPTATPTL